MKTLTWAALIYLSICALMYFLQRKLQYHPDREYVVPSVYNLARARDVRLTTPGGETIHGWFAPPGDREKQVILYFHGNAQAIQARWERAKLFGDAGYGYFLLSYRGFGGSSGTPSERGLVEDASTALAYLGERGYGDSDIVYWGESLGSGVALQLAARHTPAAIILESPFTSAANVARLSYFFVPVGLLMKDQFNSLAFIKHLKAPAFVFHGDVDEVVPFKMGQEVFNRIATPKVFHRIGGGLHVDPLTLPLWQKIDGFISAQSTARPAQREPHRK
jgi:fermentation-respiration switch protein FrsA (DUF1100 family)